MLHANVLKAIGVCVGAEGVHRVGTEQRKRMRFAERVPERFKPNVGSMREQNSWSQAVREATEIIVSGSINQREVEG